MAIMAATNGHRICQASDKCDAGELTAIIPTRAMQELKALIDASEDSPVGISQGDNHLFFSVGERKLSARKLVGQFPAYEVLMKADLPSPVVLDTEVLTAAMSRTAQCQSKETSLFRLCLSAGSVTLSAMNVEAGESEEVLACDYDGEEISVGLCSPYIMDFLRVIDSPQVTLYLKNTKDAVELRATNAGDTYRYLVAPMYLGAL